MNIAHIIETALMVLIVFVIGAILGYLIRLWFFKPQTPALTTTAGTSAAQSSAKPAPTPKPATKTPAAKTSADKAEPSAPSDDDKPEALSGPRDGKKDDLKRIKGVGPKIEKTLNGLGIYHFDQIAQWSPKTVEWINGFISFKDRIQREKWIDQAKTLASGSDTAFSKRVDKGKVPSSKK